MDVSIIEKEPGVPVGVKYNLSMLPLNTVSCFAPNITLEVNVHLNVVVLFNFIAVVFMFIALLQSQQVVDNDYFDVFLSLLMQIQCLRKNLLLLFQLKLKQSYCLVKSFKRSFVLMHRL
jgi:hypothetical protein